ncbi:pyridoxal phosphatase [Thorsellia anophelis]|uniref:Cof subfamily of IIB subfamily of haloacid dehalogenase superfamily/HAD-superfamily hydrolase, subfamily IIB n=1 Tax=Thorsellia anophelis DSM 18579 TaxID=1123402 RepID=A0A1I0CJF6_9GAMM|nr:pyridoxal phosphatase [Thorsellia anophelis]SET19749.1 hypothetical protein SAMN02583745_01643 [Thorsellia anophelis DSM 18579]
MPLNVIALDLDGTLLNDNKMIPQASLDAIFDAKAKGIDVIIATGRHHIAITEYYHLLELSTPAVCCNGVYLYDIHNDSVLSRTPVTHNHVEKMVALGNEHGIPFYLYVDKVMLYSDVESHKARISGWDEAHQAHLDRVFKHFPDYLDATNHFNDLWKFSCAWHDIPALKKFADAIEQKAGLQCLWSWDNQVDIAIPGTGKGHRLKEYVESIGKTMDNVISFGDNFNDVSMLEMAGMGVAMGNHAKGVELHADIVIGDNNSDAIAKAIRQYVL